MADDIDEPPSSICNLASHGEKKAVAFINRLVIDIKAIFKWAKAVKGNVDDSFSDVWIAIKALQNAPPGAGAGTEYAPGIKLQTQNICVNGQPFTQQVLGLDPVPVT